MTFSIHYFIVLTLSVSLLTGLHLLRAWLEPAKEVQFILSYWFANFLLLTRDLYIWFGPCSVCIDVDRQANFGWTSMEWIQPQFSFHWTGADMLNMASLSFCGLLHFCIAWKDGPKLRTADSTSCWGPQWLKINHFLPLAGEFL